MRMRECKGWGQGDVLMTEDKELEPVGGFYEAEKSLG